MKRFAAAVAVILAVLLCLAPLAQAEAKNYQTSQKWEKKHNTGKVTEMEENGQKFWRFDGVSAAYASAVIDVLPAVKALTEEAGESDLFIAFQLDARVVWKDVSDAGSEFPVGVILRADSSNEDVRDSASFSGVYYGSAFYNNSGNIICRFTQETMITNYWQTLSFEKEITEDDLDEELGWLSWNLCFDRMERFEEIKAIDVRAVGVYLSDEVEKPEDATPRPTATPAPAAISATPTPVTIREPYNFDKYPILVGQYSAQTSRLEVKPRPDEIPTEAPTVEPGKTPGKTGTSPLVWILPAAVVVVIGIAALVIFGKKKGGKQA